MLLKKATINDYDVINHIAVITWHATYGNILTAQQMDYMLGLMYSRSAIQEQMEQQGHCFLLIEADGAVLGFAAYQVDYKPGIAKLHKLYVLPEAHGKGAGKALVAEVESAVRSAGVSNLMLNVNRFNPAYNFYLKSGFINLGEVNVDIGHGFFMEDYEMQKSL